MKMMSEIEEFEYINELYAIYKSLLTLRQIEIMDKYYLYNLSLSEIAFDLKISKTAVSDSLNHAKNKLIEFEAKLNLNKKYLNLKKILISEKIDEKLIKKILKELY